MEMNKKPTSQLIDKAYKEDNEELYWDIISELHSRGTVIEFNAAKDLVLSEDPTNREMGADILGQLDWKTHQFDKECVSLLISLLDDKVADVIASAAFSLGHKSDDSAIDKLLQHINHIDNRVRCGITFGLSCLEDERAIKGLITLSTDTDYNTRNWATFGLGSQCEMDSEEIRQALFNRLTEKDPEIRGEALIGLATRKDEKVTEALIKELSGPYYGDWGIEAAMLMDDSTYCPLLQDLRLRMLNEGEEERFIKSIDEAIEVCCK